MKMTIQLDDKLIREVERIAADRGRPLSTVIEEMLWGLVSHKPDRPRRAPVSLPTFRGNGLQPGVNLDDSRSLLDRMESASASG